ncbi:hypothetical protein GCM10025876_20180 [Demequina litorisediminis]|uniref:Tetratricopeptide repeat protein n=1 Tax=Demequina litorisediminis TaxID=1849022 RepID=A0ABQ6ID98_9MICO|nr:hypothetical protein GCM10025876_20180 [Demequina litorisediminis]
MTSLYLTGLHLAQYRHPTRSPETYWERALARDAGHVPTLVAMADRLYRAGRYGEALTRVEHALDRLTRRNANPADAEAFYLSGLILARLGRDEEAEAAWGKAGWDGTWAAAAGLEPVSLARPAWQASRRAQGARLARWRGEPRRQACRRARHRAEATGPRRRGRRRPGACARRRPPRRDAAHARGQARRCRPRHARRCGARPGQSGRP